MTPFTPRRRYLLLAVAAAGAASSASFAAMSNESKDAIHPVQFAPVAEAASPVPSSDSTEFLRDAVDKLGGRKIVTAKLGSAPDDFAPTDGTVPAPAGFDSAEWAYFTVHADSNSELALRGIWEADIVAGAVRDELHSAGDRLYGTRISLLLPDGSIVQDAAGGTGNVSYSQVFPTPEETTIEENISAAGQKNGLSIESIDLLRGAQPVPAVVAVTDDASAWVQNYAGAIIDMFGKPPRYEGYYLEVRNPAGEPIFIGATSFRVGAGHLWIRPDLDPRQSALEQMIASDG